MASKVTRGRRAIEWIEAYCRIPEGAKVGQPVKLERWQKDIIRSIYDSPTRMAVISFGRKNGKTALAAFLCLLHLCGPEARPNSQLFSAARSRKQAAVLFELCAKMVRMSSDLDHHLTIRDTAKELLCPELGTIYHALSAEASTAHGLSPVFVVHDELGQVRGPKDALYEALDTGSAAHEDPLSIVISTQAPTDDDLLSRLIDDAKTGADPKNKLFLFSAETDADPFDVETIKQANPAFGSFQNKEETQRQALKAQRMPSEESGYRNLILNQRVNTNSPFISRSVWDANEGEPDLDFSGRTVWGGLDLAQRRDTSALVWLAEGDRLDVHPVFWLPEKGLSERAHQDRVPYDVWARQGHLRTSPGPTVNYMHIAQEIVAMVRRADVRGIGFDPYLSDALWPLLEQCGMDTEERDALFHKFPQNYAGMSTAIGSLEAVLYEDSLAHGGHPVLTNHAANAVAIRGSVTDQILLKKPSDTARIDGVVALAMAIGLRDSMIDTVSTPSYLEQTGLMVL